MGCTAVSGEVMRRLTVQGDRALGDLDWWMAATPAGSCAQPSDFNKVSEVATPRWVKALVPGTAAAALEAAGLWSRRAPTPLHDQDIWYLAELLEDGRRSLVLDGLATVAEVYLDDALVIATANQFRAHEIDLDLKPGQILSVVFRSLRSHLAVKGPRARWRVPMIPEPGLRLCRTTLFGHMPGWCPPIDVVGPTRMMGLYERGPITASGLRIRSDHDGRDGLLAVSLEISGGEAATLTCGGLSYPMTAENGRFSVEARLPGAHPWWPRGYGEPVLYQASVTVGEAAIDLGRVGFRRIRRDPDAAGFGLLINGIAIHCRGACWTCADLVGLGSDRETYARFLGPAADAGMTMIRVGGTMIPESKAFFDLCDELGLLVWQDFPFANFDYPADDPAFAEAVAAEAVDILEAIGGAASLAVLCGGSEAIQQAAMMGLPPERWPGPLNDRILAEAAGALRPDVPYVPHSPSGGPMPFCPGAGIAHYYGVGAYLRPLEDARRAEVGFAAECLALSHVPDEVTLARHLAVPAVHDPRWKAAVPRDLSASWDFEDVREHYLGALFGVDPARLRREDPQRHLDLSRATGAIVLEQVFAEWRRAASPNRGGLVWTLMDLVPGAGWGVIDSTGRPKPAWFGLKRAFRPVQVTLSDEGTNGLVLHLHNETAAPVAAELVVTALKDGAVPVVTGRRRLELDPRSSMDLPATDLSGAFCDFTYSYRFGPPGHDVTVARLCDPWSGAVMAEAFHHPLGLGHAFPAPTIESVGSARDDTGLTLRLATSAHAPVVHVAVEDGRPSDDWFALAPGAEKTIVIPGREAITGEIVLPGGRIVATFAE